MAHDDIADTFWLGDAEPLPQCPLRLLMGLWHHLVRIVDEGAEDGTASDSFAS